MTERLRVFALFALLSSVCGCGALDNCPDSEKPKEITHGLSNKDTLTYESAPWDALDRFPPKSQLWFKHDLGVVPLEPKAFLSFSEHGTNNALGGSVTETAGNQTLFDCVDAHYIVVRNDTCEPSFYIKIVSIGASLNDDEDRLDACGEMPR